MSFPMLTPGEAARLEAALDPLASERFAKEIAEKLEATHVAKVLRVAKPAPEPQG